MKDVPELVGDGDEVEPLPEMAHATVIRLHETPEGEDARAESRDRVLRALENKRAFQGLVQGTKSRLALLPERTFLADLGFGVAQFALMQVLTGKVQLTTAREVADIAKVGVEVGRLEAGDPSTINRPLTDEERASTSANIARLQADLQARADALNEDPEATLDDEGLTPTLTDDDDEGTITDVASPFAQEA